ncbi:uncharacterized protein [Rutidosis leptorrhynchoides]|uniref:uncharacterized protein n=1 Tax=Rutidosis leptorrhynchoides TaxID=125765 RepID=UPI003A99D33C
MNRTFQYGRDIDAINEPYRPIASGLSFFLSLVNEYNSDYFIYNFQVITQIWVIFLGGIGLAGIIDVWAGHKFPTIFYLALGGSLLSYIYSAPPLKLQAEGDSGEFRVIFGGFAPIGKKVASDDDVILEKTPPKLYCISEGQVKDVDGELSKSLLENKKCYLLDCGSEVFVWVGRVTQVDERKAAMQAAELGFGYSNFFLCISCRWSI